MNFQHIIFGLSIAILISSCGQGSSSDLSYSKEEANQEVTGQTRSKEKVEDHQQRKLIKEGWITFESQDLNVTRKRIFDAVDKYGGYVSSDKEYNSHGKSSNDITIRVPADNFDKLVSSATKGVDKFDDKNIEVKDVTEEFLDVQARLDTKKELEKRYLKLVERAGSIKEIMDVEKELGELRGEIESIEGRLRYLKSRISLSTLHMTFYETKEEKKSSGFGDKLSDNFSHGWDGFLMFFVGIIRIWPLVIIAAIITFFVRRYLKKKKNMG
jgi:predicted  nucleic acid-binding Zn-ribbon protein